MTREDYAVMKVLARHVTEDGGAYPDESVELAKLVTRLIAEMDDRDARCAEDEREAA